MPLDVAGWGLDAVYSCTQKGLGAPSGMSPIVFSPRALERRVPCRSFYFDLALLEDYWVRRKYHHTMSAPLIYALREALVGVEEEGLGGALGAARAQPSRARRRRSTHRPVAAAAAGRAPVDPERRRGAGGRGRGRRAQAPVAALQHRNWRRPRPARRQGVPHRPDGDELVSRTGRSAGGSPRKRPEFAGTGVAQSGHEKSEACFLFAASYSSR